MTGILWHLHLILLFVVSASGCVESSLDKGHFRDPSTAHPGEAQSNQGLDEAVCPLTIADSKTNHAGCTHSSTNWDDLGLLDRRGYHGDVGAQEDPQVSRENFNGFRQLPVLSFGP